MRSWVTREAEPFGHGLGVAVRGRGVAGHAAPMLRCVSVLTGLLIAGVIGMLVLGRALAGKAPPIDPVDRAKRAFARTPLCTLGEVREGELTKVRAAISSGAPGRRFCLHR
jgi:hypothetical protein